MTHIHAACNWYLYSMQELYDSHLCATKAVYDLHMCAIQAPCDW